MHIKYDFRQFPLPQTISEQTRMPATTGNLTRFFQPMLLALLITGTYPLPVQALGPQDFSQPDYEGVLTKERERREAAESKARTQEVKIRKLEAKLKAQVAAPAAPLPAIPAAARVEKGRVTGLLAGAIFRDRLQGGGEGPELVVIPAGRYWRGSAAGETGVTSNEGPQKEVRIDYGFALGRYEVTVGEYLACVSDGGCGEPIWLERGSQYHYQTGSNDFYKQFGSALTDERYPIVGVSWGDAQSYVKWLSGKSGEKYRLPSELEWEYAARGEAQGAKASQPYPWGKTASHEFANYGKDSCCAGVTAGRDRWNYTSPVGSFPENGFKLHDMHGNVWEWVADCYYDSYGNANIPVSGRPTDGGAATGCSSNQDRVLRGGSWYNFPQLLRSAIRDGNSPVFRDYIFGFRVARTLP